MDREDLYGFFNCLPAPLLQKQCPQPLEIHPGPGWQWQNVTLTTALACKLLGLRSWEKKKRMRKQSHAIGEILELTPVQLLVEPSARPPNTNMLTKIKEAWDAIWRNHQMSNKFQNSGLLTALWSNAGNLWIPMRYCRHFWHHHCVCLICQKNCDITSTWQKKQSWTHSKW